MVTLLSHTNLIYRCYCDNILVAETVVVKSEGVVSRSNVSAVKAVNPSFIGHVKNCYVVPNVMREKREWGSPVYKDRNITFLYCDIDNR